MKIKQLTEARLAKPKPQHRNLSDEKVVQMFFEEDEFQRKEYLRDYDPGDSLYGTRYFYVKKGLVVHDNRQHEIISNVVWFPPVRKGKGKWVTMDHENDQEWEVNPSKFEIDMTTPVYRK